ncbi:MAG: hypothetical protein J0H68_02640 [Sphingobacteriia bacterium]|nr:hypothetical protein [Sphingobacteriia bacterium]
MPKDSNVRVEEENTAKDPQQQGVNDQNHPDDKKKRANVKTPALAAVFLGLAGLACIFAGLPFLGIPLLAAGLIPAGIAIKRAVVNKRMDKADKKKNSTNVNVTEENEIEKQGHERQREMDGPFSLEEEKEENKSVTPRTTETNQPQLNNGGQDEKSTQNDEKTQSTNQTQNKTNNQQAVNSTNVESNKGSEAAKTTDPSQKPKKALPAIPGAKPVSHNKSGGNHKPLPTPPVKNNGKSNTPTLT